MNKTHVKIRPVVLAVASAILAAGGADAQNVTDLGIEEMVVTAQKREENLQAVPISISSLGAADIERRGVQNAADLISTLPNVSGFASPESRDTLSVSIRGVAAPGPSNLSNDPGVSIYIDGVVLGKAVSNTLDVAELERVEVLRGPQGTLYGRNSTGGAVNFITRKPSGEFGGRITGTAGSDRLRGLRASIDTATLGVDGEGAGTLKATFGAQTRKRDGLYGKDANGGQDFDDRDRQAYRIALRWEPMDTLTVDYAFDRSKMDETATPEGLVGLNPLTYDPFTGARTERAEALEGMIMAGEYALMGAGPLAAAADDPTFMRWLDSAKALSNVYARIGSTGKRPGRGAADVLSGTKSDTTAHSLTATFNAENLGVLGDVEFKSISGWRKQDSRNFADLDGVDNSIAPGGAGALNDLAIFTMYQLYEYQSGYPASLLDHPRAGMAKLWSVIDRYGGGAFRLDADYEYKQFSQELQMVGSKERLDYAIGLYYFKDDGSCASYQVAASPLVGPQLMSYDNGTEAWAVYAQMTWTPPVLDDRLAITIGYRHTEESKRVTYLYRDDGGASGGGLFGGNELNLGIDLDYTGELVPVPEYGDKFKKDFSNNSGSLTLAYQATEDTNVYLRWATGYRSGGFNGEIYNNPVDEETIEQWEFGVKSDVVPGVLRVNASVFAYEFKDMQVGMMRLVNGQPTSYTGNAGRADRWGTEVEVLWSPTHDLLFSLSWAHLDGNFEEYPPQCGTGDYLTTCIDTNHLARRPNSPDDQLSLVTDWVFASTDWADFLAHVEVFWQGKSYSGPLWAGSYDVEGGSYPHVYDHIVLKDRTLVNARIGIENVRLGNGTLRAALWARNLFDKEYNSYGMNFGALGAIVANYGEPRTWGLDVSWDF